MWTSLIKLRKKFLLPWKYKKFQKQKEDELAYPEPDVFYAKVDEIKQKIVVAERLDADDDELPYLMGATSILDWIIEYERTEEETSNS